jgi:hypothetical protein
MAKFKRGPAIATRAISDKKLKGQLQYSEKLAAEAAYRAAKAEEWLLPEEAGALEPEGLEQTWRFSQVLSPKFPILPSANQANLMWSVPLIPVRREHGHAPTGACHMPEAEQSPFTG